MTFQKSTERIPDKIVPTLDKLYEEFRTFGALLNAKIEKLQSAAQGSSDIDNHKLRYMRNLRECVRSAAEVVSTASTTLNADPGDRASVRYGSDFGDVFVRDANEPMLRWFASNTVYEYEDAEAPLPAPSEASTGDALTEYHSDTDSDLENDLIKSLFKEGRKRREHGDLTGAVRHFRNCLTRFSSKSSYVSLTAAQSLKVCGVSKAELLEHLVDSYCLLGSWGKAKSTMEEKLIVMERQVGKKDALYLKDTMKLTEIMMMNRNYAEAHLQARRCLQGFRKLGENGREGYENCLAFLVHICQVEGREDEEEAYTALFMGHTRGVVRTVPKFQSAILSPNAVQLRSPSTPDSGAESIVGANDPKESQEEFSPSHEIMQESPSPPHLHAKSSLLSERLTGTRIDTSEKHIGEDQLQRDFEAENSNELAHYEQEGVTSACDNRRFGALLLDSKPSLATQTQFSEKPSMETSEEQYDESNIETPNLPETELPALGIVVDFKRTELAGPLVEDEKPASPAETTPPAIDPSDTTAHTPTAADMLDHTREGWYESPLSIRYGTNYPIGVIDAMYTISRIAREEKVKRKREEENKTVEFLETYCKMYGNEPHYSVSPDPTGFTCMVKISSKQWCTVSGYATYHQAVDAAAAKAYKKYISVIDTDIVMGLLGRPDPSSDKEVYIPSLDEKYIVTTNDTSVQQAPGIIVTQDGQDTATLHGAPSAVVSDTRRSAGSLELRRYVSDSRMHEEQETGEGLVGKFLAKYHSALNTLRTYQPAITSLSVLHSDDQDSTSNSSTQQWLTPPNEHTTETDEDDLASPKVSCCPVCSDPLPEVIEDASYHVNKCLDREHSTVGVSQRTHHEQNQDPRTVVSHLPSSSTTLTSTEGVWACDQCKPDTLQYLSEDRCYFCLALRYGNAPSSLNGFKRDPSDCYQSLQISSILLTPPPSNTTMRRKVLLLGDTLCGKTYLASTWSKGKYPSESEDSVMNNFIKTTEIEGHQIELVIWDCNGMEENEKMRRMSYANVHMLLICFDISDPDSFANVEYMVYLTALFFLFI